MRVKSQGFSLVEVLVVIAILGILAAVAVPQFIVFRLRSIDSQVQSAVKNLVVAQEAYFADMNTYAGSLQELLGTRGFRQSVSVKLTVMGTEDGFVITGRAVSGCSDTTGYWSMSSSNAGFNGTPCS
jgi:type IV pilus assembly protein PilA